MRQHTPTTTTSTVGDFLENVRSTNIRDLKDATPPWAQSQEKIAAQPHEFFRRSYILSKFFMSLCCNSSLLIVICILLWGNESINYGIIIYNETNEWSQGGIVDIKPFPYNDTAVTMPECSEGYQIISGTYYGTNKICLDVNTQQYNIGDCEEEYEDTLVTIEDVSEQTIWRLNGTYVCYRASSHNYHDLMKNRDKYNPTKDDNRTDPSQFTKTLSNYANNSLPKILASSPSSEQDPKQSSEDASKESTQVKEQAKEHTSPNPLSTLNGTVLIRFGELSTNNDTNGSSGSKNETQLPSKYTCGSQRDNNKKYAPMEADGTCFLNDLYFQLAASTTPQNQSFQNPEEFNTNYLMIEITANDQNNPMAKLFYGISQPCINVNTQFMNRSKPIPLIYRNENNNCDSYETSLHYQYLKTGFEQTELMVYTDNNLIADIRERVPNFHEEDLTQNKYRLYYKPYALWTLKCQQKITSEEFAEFATQIMQNEENQRAILKTTSYFIGFEYIFTVSVMILNKQVKQRHSKAFTIFIGMGLLCTIGLLLGLFMMYTELFRHFFIDGVEILTFANRELCSEGVLAQAMLQYERKSTSDQSIIKIGYILSGVILILNFLNFFAFTNIKAQIHASCMKGRTELYTTGHRVEIVKEIQNKALKKMHKVELSQTEERHAIREGDTVREIVISLSAEEPIRLNEMSFNNGDPGRLTNPFANNYGNNIDITESSRHQLEANSQFSDRQQFAGTFQQEKVNNRASDHLNQEENSKDSYYNITTMGSPPIPERAYRELQTMNAKFKKQIDFDREKLQVARVEGQLMNELAGQPAVVKALNRNRNKIITQSGLNSQSPSVPTGAKKLAARPKNDLKMSEMENVYINYYSLQQPELREESEMGREGYQSLGITITQGKDQQWKNIQSGLSK
ncbi:hypothetical protein FGO68_gene12364 [Halteria grandinella]|uniref:Uncharacterized protein n=1 Tax=Halteria grandinella TaxID=5974 RepID=A0A8J8P856_HALGN|nr:hypothetical protein FGO68_gene12364 [Halteria grandinella]